MLHNDKELFEQAVLKTAEYMNIDAGIVEKDYYVTLMLKEISSAVPDLVFKGGTSLSKCHKVINRFSEDIDLTVEYDTKPSESKRKNLKKSIVAAIEKYGLELANPDDIKSRKNLAIELLKKLIAEQVSVYRRTNVVKSEKFSEIMQRSLNAYLNGMLTNEEVIEEMLKLAQQIAAAHKEGDQLGLTADELAFYDALTKPQSIKDFYENDELIAITKELADTLRKNKTIDWQKRESARAKMRMLIKKLLKKHRYPPEGMEDAVQTVMTQCELWTDNQIMEEQDFRYETDYYVEASRQYEMVAEDVVKYEYTYN